MRGRKVMQCSRGVGVAVGLVVAVACGGQTPAVRSARAAPVVRAAQMKRPPPVARVSIAWDARVGHAPDGLVLPPFPAFRDPFRAPTTSLRRLRRKAAFGRGRSGRVHMSNLSARLWRLAHEKTARIRTLRAQAGDGPTPEIQRQITQLQQQASAHLKECVVLLEGVAESKHAPRVAIYRLAHYLRTLNPRAAIPVFRRLIGMTRAKRDRAALEVDLAQLLLGAGQAEAARKLLAGRAPVGRVGLLLLLARATIREVSAAGRRRVEALLAGLRDRAASLSPDLRDSLAKNLPALLGRLRRPAAELTRWIQAGWPRATLDRVAGELLGRALAAGRLRLARSLAESLRGTPLGAVAARFGRRLHVVSGPWKAAKFPRSQRWARVIRARLPQLRSCFSGDVPASWSVQLKVQPSGRVRTVRAPALRDAAACLRKTMSRWALPPWRGRELARIDLRVRRH